MVKSVSFAGAKRLLLFAASDRVWHAEDILSALSVNFRRLLSKQLKRVILVMRLLCGVHNIVLQSNCAVDCADGIWIFTLANVFFVPSTWSRKSCHGHLAMRMGACVAFAAVFLVGMVCQKCQKFANLVGVPKENCV